MSESPNLERRAECRAAVLGFLANRHPLVFHPNDIRRTINGRHENDFSEPEIVAAAEFCAGQGWAEPVVSAAGATRYFRATPAGILAWERGEVFT